MFSFFKQKKTVSEKTVSEETVVTPKKDNKKEAHILAVMEKSGWDRTKAEKEMKLAKKVYGLTFADYNRYDFFAIPEDEKELKADEIKRRKERAKKHREQCISLAMEKCGWSKDQAKKHLEDTRARIGISYMDYRRYYFFQIPDDEQEQRYSEILASRENRKNRDSNKKEIFYKTIMDETGWTRKELTDRIADAKERTGATWKDYYAFKFWEIDEEEQATYFTQKLSNKLSEQYDVNDFHRDILLNKELSCYTFSEFFKRGWCINKTVSLEEFKAVFKDDKKVVYKPLDGNGGIGIKVFDVTDDVIEETYDEIVKLQRGVVEAFVVQHPEMSRITPSSVNTLRVVCLSTDTTSEVAYVALRIGSGKSFVDNFTDGGMVAGVDLETGTVVTNGFTVDGVSNAAHPETGTVFKGFKIPYFKEALEMVESAGRKVVGYTGWDVAITENGPVLIEANIMPGNRILQMPYVEDRIGMRHVMDRFFK